MRRYFMFIILGILISAYILSLVIIMFLNKVFESSTALPETTAQILLSILVGGILASLLSKIDELPKAETIIDILKSMEAPYAPDRSPFPGSDHPWFPKAWRWTRNPKLRWVHLPAAGAAH